MALPSGYSKIDYIEATGTQYINTYFTPNGNSRIVLDFESAAITSTVALFGARTASNENVFGMWLDAGKAQPQYGSASYATKPIAITNTVRQTYELNKGVATVGGTSVTFDNLSFSAGQPLTIFGMNSGGSIDGRRASGKLYSCKIYDNGTLVRDFVPCKADGGELGLFDLVGSVFYGNSGTGTLATGSKHKTLINGTGYEVKSGRVLIAGTGYDIKKGRTLIDGTGYDIGFGTPVGELAVGSSVYMNVDGVRKEFIIVHQGNPDPTIYDASCNGTWVAQKQHAYDGKFNSQSGNNKYEESLVHSFLNNTYLKKLDSGIQALIKQVKIPYQKNGSFSGSTLSTGANGLSTKIFTFSLREVGKTLGWDLYHPDEAPNDGAKLDFFLNGAAGNARRTIFTYNGFENYYWLRSPWLSSNTNSVWAIGLTGVVDNAGEADTCNGLNSSLCPAVFILPQSATIDDNYNIIPS